MTNHQILKQAYKITASKTSLWWLGIFLSSGFNLHFWFGLYWFDGMPLPRFLSELYSILGQTQQWLLLFLIIILGLIFFNYIKIVFLSRVHSALHDKTEQHCMLCGWIKDKSIYQVIKERKSLLTNVILVSALTVLATLGIAAIYNIAVSFLFDAWLILVLLVAILAIVSLWNLFAVLFMLFYGQSFGRAMWLSIHLIFARFGKVFLVTLWASLTLIFTVAIGSIAINQLTDLLNRTPLHTWYYVMPLLSAILFMAWLILNNIWFNIVMVILFDELVSGVKHGQMEKVMPVAPSA